MRTQVQETKLILLSPLNYVKNLFYIKYYNYICKKLNITIMLNNILQLLKSIISRISSDYILLFIAIILLVLGLCASTGCASFKSSSSMDSLKIYNYHHNIN